MAQASRDEAAMTWTARAGWERRAQERRPRRREEEEEGGRCRREGARAGGGSCSSGSAASAAFVIRSQSLALSLSSSLSHTHTSPLTKGLLLSFLVVAAARKEKKTKPSSLASSGQRRKMKNFLTLSFALGKKKTFSLLDRLSSVGHHILIPFSPYAGVPAQRLQCQQVGQGQ